MAQNHLKIRIEAEGGDAKAVLSDVRRQIKGVGESAERAERRTKRAFSGIDRQFGTTAGMISRLKYQMAGLLAVIGGGAIAKNIIETSNAFTQYRMTLDTLEGSHEKAAQKWQELLQFAEQTPFTISQVMQAYKTMKAYGLDPTIEAMKALGDASAVLGGDTFQRIAYALGQVHSAGKLMGQDMRQLTEAGINVKKVLKEAFGTADLDRLNARIESGAIQMQQVYDAFLQYMRDHFGGQMQRLNLTLKGQWEVLISLWQELSDKLMNTGIADSLTATLMVFNEWFGAIQKDKAAIKELSGDFDWFAEKAAKAIYSLKIAFDFVGMSLKWWQSLWHETIYKIEDSIASLSIKLANTADKLHFEGLAGKMYDVAKSASNMAWEEYKAFKKAKAGVISWGDSLQDNIVGLETFSTKLFLTKKHIEQLRNATKHHTDATKRNTTQVNQASEAYSETVQKIKQAYDAAMAFIQVHEQTDTVAMQIERLKQEYSRLEEAIWSAFEAGVIGADEAWQAMDRLKSAQQNDTQRILSAHKKSAKGVSEAWKNAYNQVTNFLEDWLSGSRSLVQSFLDWIRHALAQVAATSIVGSIAGGLGLPGAAAWAGTGGIGGAAGFSSIGGAISAAGGVWNWINGGLSSFGNTLMYGVPEKLLDWGFTDAAFTLGSLPPELMGGLTAGIGTFLLNGLLTGDWAKAAVSGASTGIGAGIGSIIAPGIGTAIGALVGGIGGHLLGGLFGDGTERTYLRRRYTYSYDQDLGASYTYRTTRWDRGTPDWMDTLVDTEDKLARSIQETLTSVITTLDKFSPGFAEKMSGRGFEYQTYWGVEDKKEFEKRYVQNVVGFSREIIGPVIEEFKTDFQGELSGLDLSLFTEDAKKQIYDTFDKAFAQIDFSHIKSIDDLKEQFSRLNAVLTKEKQLEEYVANVKKIQKSYKVAIGEIDKYHSELDALNEAYEEQRQKLKDMGVDMEKMPQFYEAWAKAINDLKLKIFGFALDVPEKFDEAWAGIIHDISQLDIGGKLAELLNQALEDPGRLASVGQEWAQWLSDSMKSSILSGAVSSLMDQVKTAYIQPIMQEMIGSSFSAQGIMGAFTRIDEAMPQLAQAGQSIAEVINYIQRTGNLAGFDWDEWKANYGSTWDEINKRNQEASDKMKDAADLQQKVAKYQEEAAESLKKAAAALESAGDRIQQPPDVHVHVTVAAPEANLA